MKQYTVFVLLSITLLASCRSRNSSNESGQDSIVVVYNPGFIDFSIRQSCHDLQASGNRIETDTVIYLDMESYNDILAAIHNCDTLEENAIDCRLIIKHGSLVMGFGYPDRFQLSKDSNYVQGCYVNDKGVMLSSNILYELKKISGYYNYFSIEELEDDYLIKKYGIPHNYYYAYENGGEESWN